MCNCFRFLSVITLMLCIAGCGFQLRGTHKLPDNLQTLSISPDDPYDPFQRELRRSLRKQHVSVVSQQAENPVNTLILTNTDIDDQVIGYSPSGQPQRYRLTYNIGYKVLAPNGKILQPQKTLQRSREFSKNTNRLHSSKRERETIIEELNHELVHTMLRQLASDQ